MGAEYSVHKNRAVSLGDESMTPRFRNNYHPLHFHQVHGENVKLSKNGSVACRSEGFCKGIAFSDRPVMVWEPIHIKFLEISSNWSGALRIGFTMHDPLSMKSKLPRYACPDLTSMHGNWAKAIAERLAKKDSILFYYVDQNGDVHYGIDSEEHGIFFGGVNTSGKLWAIIDIYGNTVAVEFIDPDSFQDSHNDIQSVSVATLRTTENLPLTQGLDLSSLNFSCSFHHIHGKNLTLRQNGSVASRKPGFHSLAYAFTERPLKLGEQVFFQILKTDNFYNGNLIYGITSCNPSTINPYELPENPDDLLDRPEYWVARQDSNLYTIGEIIIYILSSEGEIAVRTNGKHATSVFHVDPTQPLWLFINMAGSVSEVWFIGTSLISANDILTKQMENMMVSLPDKSEDLAMKPGTSGQQSFSECVICCEESVDCALYRCGHVCMCYNCAMKMWKPNSNVQCPICRKTIQDIIKIYP